LSETSLRRHQLRTPVNHPQSYKAAFSELCKGLQMKLTGKRRTWKRTALYRTRRNGSWKVGKVRNKSTTTR